MARKRGKKSTRRRDNSVKLLNVAEAYTYSNIMTVGIFGSSVPEFITGKDDISTGNYNLAGWKAGTVTDEQIDTSLGIGSVSIRDIASNPQLAMESAYVRLMANGWDMVGKTLVTRWGFKWGKRLLRQPIGMINRTVFKPLAIGIKL